MVTCEVTFDGIMPCTTPVSECAGEKELGECIFMEEEQKDADYCDPKLTPLAAPIEPTSTMSVDGPSTSTSLALFKLLAQPRGEQAQAEEEDISRREALRHF
jgi:hypothetical protein